MIIDRLRHLIVIISLAAVVFINVNNGLPVNADSQNTENQILVVMQDDISRQEAEKIADDVNAKLLEVTETGDQNTVAVMETGSEDTLPEAIEKAEANPDVAYAQPNYRYELEVTDDYYNSGSNLLEWYLNAVGAEDAWEKIDELRSDRAICPVRVAVLDSGAAMDHEDLQAALNKELSVNIDKSGNISPMTKDMQYHGTHVSGIIAGTAGNGIGIAGVASGGTKDKNLVDLVEIGVCTQESNGIFIYTSTLVTAIKYAVDHQVRIMNMSLGEEGEDKLLEESIADAYDKGVLCVCAAGNSGTDTYMNPSDFGETISVINMNRNEEKASTSSYGIAKDLSAPGENIISTYPEEYITGYEKGYNCRSGTSVAAPVVTATAAMVFAVNPELTPAQVRNILCASAKDIGDAGFDEKTGYGVVRADKAVTAASEASADTDVESISFKMDSCVIDLEEKEMLQILVLPASSLKPVSWSSSNPSVVLVDAKGRITGKQAGTAVISASCGGKQDEITVTVSGAEKSEITETPASSEDAAGSSKTIYKGSDYSLKVKGIAYNKIQLTWKKLSGVSGYEIYRSEKMDSGYKMIRTVSGSKTTYSDSNRTTGKKYYYRIRAYYKENSIKYCSYSSGVSVVPRLATPSVKLKAGKKKITLSWKKISGASGYVIYRSSKKNGTYKRIAVVKSGKTVKYINTKLPAKKKYYYKVKAYRKTTSGKKVCSSASKCAGTRSK